MTPARLLNRAARLAVAGPLSRLHAALYRRTGGRFLPRWFGGPVMVLEVAGRRTGRPRRTPVIYVPDGDRFLVMGANAGADRVPQWFLNVRAADRAVVQVRARRIPVTAREVTGEEYQRLWDVFVRAYPAVDQYATFTTRRFPIAVLEPDDGSAR